ncbi:MAG: hypothetical protein QOE45_2673 [Frankiaceae bacterium]|jgi:predicted transcriptional regulator|nr:hypothetical protein [Frankiaceae bacterium]
MNEAARLLRHARRRAGLTQRALVAKAGVPQPSVARIDRNAMRGLRRLTPAERMARAGEDARGLAEFDTAVRT